MASSQNFSVYAGDSEALSMTMLQIDAIRSVDLSAVTQIHAEFKRVQSDPDPVAYISKTLFVQTITNTGGVGGNTFTLTIGGQTTGSIAYNAAASVVKTAVEALSSVGSGNSIVWGGALQSAPVNVVLTGTAADQAITATPTGVTTTITAAGGGVTIVSPTLGQITVQLVPADTAGVLAQLQLQYAVKAFFSPVSEVTGAVGLLTVTATVIHTT